MASMYLTIRTPDQMIFEGNVAKVNLPGTKGPFQVLPSHAALLTTLEEGYISYQVDTREYRCSVAQGIVEILDNKVTILVETNPI